MAVVKVFSGTVTTGTISTSTAFDANQYGSVYVLMNLSAAAAIVTTAPTITVRSYYGTLVPIVLRVFTASCNAVHFFKLGDPAFSTGAETGTTGIDRFGRITVECLNSGTVTGGAYDAIVNLVIPPSDWEI